MKNTVLFAVAILSAAGGAGGFALVQRETAIARADDTRAAAPASRDPFADFETTKPALPVRAAKPAEQRSRAALPAVDVLRYSDASGTWTKRVDAPGQAVHGSQRLFARSEQRVRLSNPDDGETWIFERNPLAPLRGHGFTFLPTEQLIIQSTWPELLDVGFGPTWNDLACLGIDTRLLDELDDTGATEEAFGLTFRVLRGAGVELVWNDEHALPLRMTRTTGDVVAVGELTELELGPNHDWLRSASELQPEWSTMDISDWREEHHEKHH